MLGFVLLFLTLPAIVLRDAIILLWSGQKFKVTTFELLDVLPAMIVFAAVYGIAASTAYFLGWPYLSIVFVVYFVSAALSLFSLRFLFEVVG